MAVILLFSARVSAELPFQPFTLEYTVGNDSITAGTATISLVDNGDTWTYSLRTRPTGVFKLLRKGRVDESSTFSYTDNQQIRVHSYSFRQGGESRRNVNADFNCEKNALVSVYRGTNKVHSIDCSTQDRLIVTLSMIQRLKKGQTLTDIPVFSRGAINTYTFDMTGQETIETKFGQLDTYKVVSQSTNNPRQRITTTWFAPELDYFPVRIEQHKAGKLVARMTLTRAER